MLRPHALFIEVSSLAHLLDATASWRQRPLWQIHMRVPLVVIGKFTVGIRVVLSSGSRAQQVCSTFRLQVLHRLCYLLLPTETQHSYRRHVAVIFGAGCHWRPRHLDSPQTKPRAPEKHQPIANNTEHRPFEGPGPCHHVRTCPIVLGGSSDTGRRYAGCVTLLRLQRFFFPRIYASGAKKDSQHHKISRTAPNSFLNSWRVENAPASYRANSGRALRARNTKRVENESKKSLPGPPVPGVQKS